MDTKKVSDLMVPIDEYATVPSDATLYEAVAALEAAQESFDRNHYRHRSILVIDDNDVVIGRLSQRDILESLEPGYRERECDPIRMGQYACSYIKSLRVVKSLWDKPMDDICRKAGSLRVSDLIEEPTEMDYIAFEESLNEAIHHFVVSHKQVLLVIKAGKVVGVLRLADCFDEVYQAMKSCQLPPAVD